MQESEEVGRKACPNCVSQGRDSAGDNLVQYSSGWSECFACGFKEGPPKEGPTPYYEDILNKWATGAPMVARGISDEAADFFGVRFMYHNGKEFAYAYPLTVDRKITGFQCRKLNVPKDQAFFRRGNTKGIDPFGWNTVPDRGQMLIVAEGQDDVIAAKDILLQLGKAYKVVGSLGTTHWKKNLDKFEGYDKVLIAFDQDDAGQEAANEFAEALSPGKAHIMSWSGAKDINDLLKQGRHQDFMTAINGAKPLAISGVIQGEEAWNIIKDYSAPEHVPYPPEWEMLNKRMHGMRRGELSLWCAGSSIGKSLFMRRMKQYILQAHTWNVADVELEEQKEKTIRAMLQFQAGKPLFQQTIEERRAAYEATYGSGRLITLDHRARRKGSNLISKFRHLRYAYGTDIVFMDHGTLGMREYGDGMTATDDFMEDALELVESTGMHLCIIFHLRKPPGGDRSWARGAIPSEDDIKGSGSIYQIAADIVALSRDKMHENEYIKNTTTLHTLKCRETGNTGVADQLYFDPDSRLLVPADPFKSEDQEEGGQYE
jgi:twinkle protein